VFCRNCGEELNDDAKFCYKCGNEVKSKTKIEDNNVKFKIVPEFVVPYKILSNIIQGVLLSFSILFILMYIGVRAAEGFVFVREPITWMFLVLFIIVYVIIKMITDKMQYNDLEYSFYDTKIEYKDGFFNKEEKEVKYKYIREIIVSQNVLERMFSLGTIKIFTNASTGNSNSINGIYIHCVGNVQEQYRAIKQIIDKVVKE